MRRTVATSAAQLKNDHKSVTQFTGYARGFQTVLLSIGAAERRPQVTQDLQPDERIGIVTEIIRAVHHRARRERIGAAELRIDGDRWSAHGLLLFPRFC